MRNMKKILSFLLAFSMVLSYVPMPTLAAENGLCAHHVKHDEDCGYVAAVEGSDCNHQCTESCTRKDVTLCVHDHAAAGCIHTEAAEAVACDHVHDDSCNYNEAEDTCDHQHGECAYKPAVKESWSCGHVCTVDTGCVKAVCVHEHADCGFVQAVEGKECTFVCQECKAEEEKVCTCESTDPGEHAPFCDLYVRTYEECKCVLSCAVEGLNEWCETCYFEGVAACTGGEEEQAAYAICDPQNHKLDDENIPSDGTRKCKYCVAVFEPNGELYYYNDNENGTTVFLGNGALTAESSLAYELNSKVFIGEGITSIGDIAFRGCSSLGTIIIQGDLTSIGRYAFQGCVSLETICYYGTTAPVVAAGNDFDNVKLYSNVSFGDLEPSDSSGTTYTVTYKPGEYGTGTETTDTKYKDKKLTLKDAIFTRDGYTQVGWIAENGLDEFPLEGPYIENADITLYPIWKLPLSYTVTVTTDGNGTASADPASAAEGTEVTLTTAPKNGYKFKEWQVVSGGVTITNNKFTMGNTNVEIKAIFAPIHEHNWTYSVNEAKDTITATCGAAGCTVNGEKATITLTAPADLTYSGTAKTVTVVQSPENTFSLPELSLTGDQTSAGNHSASLIMGDAMATVSYTIAKRSITITADNQTIAYGGALTEKDVTITGDGLASGETLDSVTLTPSTTNVTINGTITPSNAVIKNGDKDVTANYSIDYVNGTLIINKAQTPEVPIPTVSDIYYGQALSDAQLTENWQWKDSSFVPLAGDQYPAVLSVDDVNYDYTGVEGYDSQTHTVTRNIQVMVYKATPVITVTAVPSSAAPEKTVTVTASIVNPYNANMTELLPELTLTYKIGDGEPQTITGNSFTIPRGTAENTVITITAAAADNGKYIDASETTEVTVTAKLPQTITAPTAGITVTYGQPVFALGAEASHGELSYNVNPTDVVSIDPDGNITVHKAGNATITVTAAETEDYAQASVDIPIMVKPAALTIGPKAISLTQNATAPELEMACIGLQGTDTIGPKTYTLGLFTADGQEINVEDAVKKPGSYTIRWLNMNEVSFDELTNYEVTKVETAVFEVKALPVVIPPAVSEESTTTKSTTSTYTPAPKPITVPISGEEKTVHVEAEVKGTTASIDKVDDEMLHSVIGSHVETGTVTIDFSVLDKNIDTVVLHTETIQQIAKAAHDEGNDTESLEIKLTDGVSIEFCANSLAEKVEQAKGKDITISIQPSHKVKTLTTEQKQEIGLRPAYDVTVMSDGKYISDLGGEIIIHAPYTLKQGEKAEGLVVYYVDDQGNREACETSYDSEKKRVNWKTDHLSLYMIAYEEPAEDITEAEVPAAHNPATGNPSSTSAIPTATNVQHRGGNNWMLWISGSCLAMAVVLSVYLFFLMRKQGKYQR